MSIREFYLADGSLITQYRFGRLNGWGGRWEPTPFLARVSLRRALKAER